MLRALVICATLLPAAVMAQENCRYYSGDGLSVSVGTDAFKTKGHLTIHGSDGSDTQCALSPGPAETMRYYSCDGFQGDVILVPKEPFGAFPDIIVMPPNILYWSCPVAG
jgi:hypothetical protein